MQWVRGPTSTPSNNQGHHLPCRYLRKTHLFCGNTRLLCENIGLCFWLQKSDRCVCLYASQRVGVCVMCVRDLYVCVIFVCGYSTMSALGTSRRLVCSYMCIYTHIYSNMCPNICKYVCMYVCTICICICLCISIYIYIYIYIYLCLCVYIHVYIHMFDLSRPSALIVCVYSHFQVCVCSHPYTHLPPPSRPLALTYAWCLPPNMLTYLHTYLCPFIGACSFGLKCIYVHISIYSCSNYHMLATSNTNVLVSRSVLYSKNPLSHSIWTYVRVPINVHKVMIICLSLSDICMCIQYAPMSGCLLMYTKSGSYAYLCLTSASSFLQFMRMSIKTSIRTCLLFNINIHLLPYFYACMFQLFCTCHL